MNGDTFYSMMRNMYAVFNRPVPPDSSPFIMSVWERVQHIPDEAVPYIVAQVADEERMPQNMGRAILRAWESWQANNPFRVAHDRCEVCGDEGFFWCWKRDGKGRHRHFLSPCPACRRAEYPLPSARELAERGFVVMPAGYEGGPLLFDRNAGFGSLWPENTRQGAGRRLVADARSGRRPDPRRFRERGGTD